MKEIAMAMVAAGHRVDIVTRRIIDPEWPEFSASIDYYDDHAPELRIVRIPCGGDGFLAKEQLWDHLPEFVAEAVKFYGRDLPDFMTAHYAGRRLLRGTDAGRNRPGIHLHRTLPGRPETGQAGHQQ